jgi:hypothetical protein
MNQSSLRRYYDNLENKFGVTLRLLVMSKIGHDEFEYRTNTATSGAAALLQRETMKEILCTASLRRGFIPLL